MILVACFCQLSTPFSHFFLCSYHFHEITRIRFKAKVVALKCWECDTRFDSECGHGDKISSSIYRNCSGELGKIPVCIKIGSPCKHSELIKIE